MIITLRCFVYDALMTHEVFAVGINLPMTYQFCYRVEK